MAPFSEWRSLAGALTLVALLAAAAHAEGPPASPGSSDKKPSQSAAPAPEKPDYSAYERSVRGFLDAENAIKPLPVAPIPDPPPHEGAMIGLPYIVEPPDVLVVEVLESLPGRPITGQHLVRPDGTISLAFYGYIYVKGLTLEQVKEKVVLRLRQFISDETLGLLRDDLPDPEAERQGAFPAMPELPPQPDDADSPLPAGEPRPRSVIPPVKKIGARADFVVPRSRNPRTIRRAATPQAQVQGGANTGEAPTRRLEIQAGAGTKITIDISVDSQSPAPPGPKASGPKSEQPGDETLGPRSLRVPPKDVGRVWIDVASYNSKHYFVQGDAVRTARYPWTGNETVLDAINHANGLMPTADEKNIRLVRPARAGKPTRIYEVDYKAIVEGGDPRKNYQLFPGDRLVIGRNDVVRKTIEIDRFYQPLRTVMNGLSFYLSLNRSLAESAPDMTSSQREALIKEWADLWWKATTGPRGAVLDKKTFEDALLRHLPAAPKPAGEPKSPQTPAPSERKK